MPWRSRAAPGRARARLDAIAREIEAKLAKADKSQAYTDDMVTSVDQLIGEAAKRCKKLKLSFNAWLKKCPSIRKSRAYEQRAVALKLKTAEQVRADTRKRLARHVVKVSVNGKTVKLGAADSASAYAMGTGGGDEWFTPTDYLKMAREVLGGFDTCPASNAFAQRRFDFGPRCKHYTKADDALTKSWRGRVWLNPPFSKGRMSAFVDKLLAEYSAGRVSAAILLANVFSANAWFQKAGRAATAICFMKKRIEFEREGSETPGSQIYGQAFFFYGDDAAPFIDVFAPHGLVVEVVPKTKKKRAALEARPGKVLND